MAQKIRMFLWLNPFLFYSTDPTPPLKFTMKGALQGQEVPLY